MQLKTTVKISIDAAMTVLLLLLMARQVTGETAHEWLGVSMFALWIAHHILNFRWYSGLRKGRYNALRIVRLTVNFLLLLSMAGMMVSGIVLSTEVFSFLPVSGGISWARLVHMLCAFWGFVLMAVHLGLHWNMILGMIRKKTGPVSSAPLRVILRVAGAAVAAYGLYAFLHNSFLSYMFLRTHFVFVDYEQPALLFFVQYIAIMEFFSFLAYYGEKILRVRSERKTK